MILDSDSNAVDVFSFFESDVITFELSARGCPLTLTLYDFVQPNGALLTSSPSDWLSINFSKDSAVDGDARFELRCA